MFWSSCPFCLVCRCSMLGPSVSKKSFELKQFLLCRVQSVKTGARQNRQKKSGGKDWDHSPKPTKMVRGRSQISTYLNQETLHSSNGKEGALRPPEVNGSWWRSWFHPKWNQKHRVPKTLLPLLSNLRLEKVVRFMYAMMQCWWELKRLPRSKNEWSFPSMDQLSPLWAMEDSAKLYRILPKPLFQKKLSGQPVFYGSWMLMVLAVHASGV